MSGKPIAFIINYAVHAVVMGDENYEISGDLVGATSRYVENYYRNRAENAPRDDAGAAIRPRAEQTTDRTVAMWTSGAAGDQNPVSLARGSDFTMVEALGKILGEEAVRVAAAIHTSDQVRLWGRQQVFTCPGRKLEAGPVPRRDYKWDDGDPVHIRLSLLMVNDVALAAVSGEVLTMIHEHLKEQAGSTRIVMVTHTNGSSGYIPDDASFGQVSYEITTSALKPGCAENKIISGFLDLIKQRQRSDTDTKLSD